MTKFAGDGQVAAPSTAVATPPAVIVRDAYGNPRSGTSVSFTAGQGAGSVSGTPVVSDTNGIARVGAWIMGAKGPNTLTATATDLAPVTFAASSALASPDVTVRISSPVSSFNTVVGTALPVRAQVTSRLQLASVRAVVAGVSTDLTLVGGSWEGTVPLQGVARDTQRVVVTATDVNGSATDAFANFIHDEPPTLSVASPRNLTVAHPNIDIDATCTDDGPAGCTITVFVVSGAFTIDSLVSGTSHIQASVSMAHLYDQLGRGLRNLSLVFVALDSRGQGAQPYSIQRTIYLEFPQSTLVTTVSGEVLDYRGGRVLYKRETDSSLVIRSPGGAEEVLGRDPYATSKVFTVRRRYYLTPTGAISLGQRIAGDDNQTLYEWRNGVTTIQDKTYSLDVNASYAAYDSYDGANATNLYRRNLATGTDDLVFAQQPSGFSVSGSVGLNGDVAFASNSVFRYRAAQLTQLSVGSLAPLTDGVNVVYRKCCTQPFGIALHDGTSETVLVSGTSSNSAPYVDYAVNGGWTAFTKPDANGARQLWLRSPTGAVRQQSSTGTSVQIDAIGDDGTVVFRADPMRYYVTATGVPVTTGTSQGMVVRRDDGFYQLLGASVFRVVP